MKIPLPSSSLFFPSSPLHQTPLLNLIYLAYIEQNLLRSTSPPRPLRPADQDARKQIAGSEPEAGETAVGG